MTDDLLRQALLLALCPAPAVLVFFLSYRRRQTSAACLQQMRRRPVGESFRAKLEEIDLQIHEWLVYLAICPPILGLAGGFIKAPGIVLPLTLFSVSVIWTGVCAWKLWQLNHDRGAVALAFDGTRYVGEQLNRLIAEGFEVYHDVPLDSCNIDHVLIGPPGVFAIETKVRQNPGGAGADGERGVEFDGFRVKWPASSETYGLERVVANAHALGQWLTSATGERIDATPILTLPGWRILRAAANQDVLVLNPKEIGQLCDSRTVRLEEDLIRRICHQMNQKCAEEK